MRQAVPDDYRPDCRRMNSVTRSRLSSTEPLNGSAAATADRARWWDAEAAVVGLAV